MEPIILASESLRRQDYFRLLGLPFKIMPPLLEEETGHTGDPQKAAEEAAVRKVQKAMETLKKRMPDWICGADTIISLNGDIYGKPGSREEAKQTLEALQGREHEVITSVALYNGREKRIASKTVTSIVSFAPLSEGEIEWYLNTGEWQGAAGAYKIQGLAGCFVTLIKGSPSGIVGLPIREFYVILRENGYPYGG